MGVLDDDECLHVAAIAANDSRHKQLYHSLVIVHWVGQLNMTIATVSWTDSIATRVNFTFTVSLTNLLSYWRNMQQMPMYATSNHMYTQLAKARPTMSCILLVIIGTLLQFTVSTCDLHTMSHVCWRACMHGVCCVDIWWRIFVSSQSAPVLVCLRWWFQLAQWVWLLAMKMPNKWLPGLTSTLRGTC